MLLSSSTPHFENAAGTLARHPAGYLRLNFAPGLWQVAELAELLLLGEELMVAHGWRYVLTDARQLDVFTLEVMHWLRYEWLMRGNSRPSNIIKAVVVPISFAACEAIGLLREHAPALTRYTYFGTETDAHNYLVSLLSMRS